MKKQSDLSRLMGYAGNYRYFTYASWVLSAVSALVALVPFVYIWKILRDVLNACLLYTSGGAGAVRNAGTYNTRENQAKCFDFQSDKRKGRLPEKCVLQLMSVSAHRKNSK